MYKKSKYLSVKLSLSICVCAWVCVCVDIKKFLAQQFLKIWPNIQTLIFFVETDSLWIQDIFSISSYMCVCIEVHSKSDIGDYNALWNHILFFQAFNSIWNHHKGLVTKVYILQIVKWTFVTSSCPWQWFHMESKGFGE